MVYTTTFSFPFIMATWFVVVGRIPQVEGIPDSVYKNALCEFEEGERNSRDGEIRTFYIAFYGSTEWPELHHFWKCRLPTNNECKAPKVSLLLVCFTGYGALS